MDSTNIHQSLASYALGSVPSEEDALAMMLLLHTHRIWFARPMMNDRPGITDVAAITQRHAAEVLASCEIEVGPEKSSPEHWFYLFNMRTPYEIVEDIPSTWIERIEKLRIKLLQYPDIARIESED